MTEIKLNLLYISHFSHSEPYPFILINRCKHLSYFPKETLPSLAEPRAIYWQESKRSAVAPPEPTRLQMWPNVVYLSIPFSPAASKIEAARLPHMEIWRVRLVETMDNVNSGGHNAPWLAHVGVFVYIVSWALGFFFCKYGKWKTNGFSVLIVRCHLASHPCMSLSLCSPLHS